MRTHGTLTKWNDDRGFGFITPAKGTADLFVHISAFPRDGVRPRLNELVSFEVEKGADGRQKAVRIMRPAQKSVPSQSRAASAREQRDRSPVRFGGMFTLLLGVVVAIYGYTQYNKRVAVLEAGDSAVQMPVERFVSPESSQVAPVSRYSCDGRTQCTQMHSCEEATFFISNCPNTQMDGDNDGVPCEQQWCASR